MGVGSYGGCSRGKGVSGCGCDSVDVGRGGDIGGCDSYVGG